MATRFDFDVQTAKFPSSNAAQRYIVNNRPVLAFDAGTNEAAYFEGVVPQGWTGAITAIVYFFMASATSGDVDVDVAVESVTPTDSFDLDAGDSFDTTNSTDNTTVPGTAGYLGSISVTLTNNDSSAAGDKIRFSLTRDASSDTATGDMYVYGFEVRDGA
jgi:hypothetical protein